MGYRLAMFDFDGTLADSFPWFLRVMDGMAAEFDFKRIEEGELETLRGYNARQMMKHLGVPGWKVPRLATYMRRRMADEIHEIAPFEGIDDMLRRLSSGGVALAVVTSNSEENVRSVLGPASAARIAYYECGVSMFGKRAKLRKVLRKSGVPPGEAIFIGDEIRDADAARGEGIRFGGVSWGYTTAAALEAHSTDGVFATVDDIAGRVLHG
jgi:phosphoglycolate phosphatase